MPLVTEGVDVPEVASVLGAEFMSVNLPGVDFCSQHTHLDLPEWLNGKVEIYE